MRHSLNSIKAQTARRRIRFKPSDTKKSERSPADVFRLCIDQGLKQNR